MQERFRLRYWDKQINKMRTGDILMGSGQPYVIGMDTGTPIAQEIDDVVPMLCTGFWDCKSKLLYENDLIEINKRKDCISKSRIVERNRK